MERVLHVVMGMDRGGIETFIMNVYRNINHEKIQFDFLVHTKERKSYDEEIYSLGGRIYYITPRSKSINLNKKDLINFFRLHPEYKIIHQHVSSLTYIEPIKIAKKFNIPIRITHGHSTKQGGSKIHILLHNYNKLFIKKNATDYFACSNKAAKWMYRKSLLKNKDFSIINNGIDSKKFTYDFNIRNRVREEYDLEDKLVIGHIGRFSKPKNHVFILEVFEKVIKQNSNATLLLVGDGKLREYINELILDKGLSRNIIITGVKDNTSELLNAMDIFLFPSIYEGLGIALVEAQSTGLKCFVSDAIPDEAIVSNNVERISLKKSSSFWAERIMCFKKGYIRKDNSLKIISEKYDIKEIASNLEKFYLSKS